MGTLTNSGGERLNVAEDVSSFTRWFMHSSPHQGHFQWVDARGFGGGNPAALFWGAGSWMLGDH